MAEKSSGSDLETEVSRRTFHKVALGAGAVAALGPALSSCRGGSSSRPSRERRALHFDLSSHPAESTFELRALGKRYPLALHTEETRNQALAANPSLGGGTLTHYAEDVELSAEKLHMFSVTTVHPQRGFGLATVGVHIPSDARAAVASQLRSVTGSDTSCPTGNVCGLCDQVPDEFVTGFDAAKAVVMHHPEIANLDKDIAAAVEVHICSSAAVVNLAVSICGQGAAFEASPDYEDGWCVLVPQTNADGTPMRDSAGKQVYDYRFSEQTSRDLKPAVQDVLRRIKNDPALKDKAYTVRTHGETDDGGDATSRLAQRLRLWQSNGVQVAATETGYQHNVWFKPPVYTGRDGARSFGLDIINMNFIWYGLYVEYLDPAGNPVPVPGEGPMLSMLNSTALLKVGWVESDTFKWLDVIGSPPTVFGIPLVPYPRHVELTLPEGATAARVMLCGPGAWGKVDFAGSLIAGVLLTAIFQFALPTFFLCSGAGLDEDKTLWDKFKTPAMKLKIFMAAVDAARELANPGATHEAALIGSVESLLASLLQVLLQLATTNPDLAEWTAEKVAKEEAEEAVPFVGWVLRIVAIMGTVADMVASVSQITGNPLVIENVVTFAASVDLTVSCDPGDYQFPEEATYYEVQYTVAGAVYPDAPKGFDLSQAERGQRTLRVTIDGVPTTGRTDDAVEIWFYSGPDRKFLAGHGRAKFTNRAGTDGSVTAAVTIEENPIPLTSATTYHQHRKLERKNGQYVWNEDPATLRDPVIERAGCSDGGLCELTNISVWVPGGMLGYSWMRGTQHLVKNVNAQEADPNPGMKLLETGQGAPTPVAYDKTAPFTPDNLNGRHFYLDPVDISISSPAYHLRRLSLDPASGQFKADGSWGKFAMKLDRLAVHPDGYVVGLSTNDHKLGILKLPSQAYPDDAHANNAVLKLGYGEEDQFVKRPQALTVSRTGAILILEGEGSFSIKAFDRKGNPWKFFLGGTASTFPLEEPDGKWLDIAIDDTEMLYVLSYTGTGTKAADYRLDVYDKRGTRLFRNTGIAVARMTVDKWRRIYTLNQEVMKDSPLVEPTVSVWMPSIPGATR